MRTAFCFFCVVAAGLCARGEQAEPLSPQESLSKIVVDPALRVELVASEPAVFDPVALCFDAGGRLYVVEDRGYPSGPGSGKPPAGSVALLLDRDGDGVYENRTVFADGFSFPNGVMPWKGGVIVTDAPNVYFLRDSDGDGRADVREAILTGFAEGGSTQLRVSHPTLGIDNWVYFTNGLSGGRVSVPGHPDAGVVDMGGSDLRWNPMTNALETTAGQAQFGLTFDDFGNKFVCSNRKHIQMVMLQPKDLSRNPKYSFNQCIDDIPDHGEAARLFPLSENKTTAYSHTGTFTAACGLHIYRGNALPATYCGNAFVCDPTGNLVHRDVLISKGPGLVAQRGEDGREFLATRDNWSRPVFLTTGPDGALYLCDMYRKSIEHPTYLPKEIAAVTDFEAGKDKGRIYRITSNNSPDAGEAIRKASMENLPSQALAARLDDSNGWTRDTARRLLLERSNSADARLLKHALRKGDSGNGSVSALHLLDSLGRLDNKAIDGPLHDKRAIIRAHAVRLLRSRPELDAKHVRALLALSKDPDSRTRFETALELGDVNDGRVAEALAEILARDIDNPWTQAAVLGSAGRDTGLFVAHLIEKTGPPVDLARVLGSLVGRSENTDDVVASFRTILRVNPPAATSWRFAFLLGVCEGAEQNKLFARAGNVFDALTAICKNDDGISVCLRGVSADAVTLAGNGDAPEADRLAAIALLAHMGYADAGKALTTIVTGDTNDEVRVAAVRSLSPMTDASIAETLTHREVWAGFTPKVRAVAVAALVRTPQRVPVLLSALEQGTVEPWTLDASQRAFLTNSADAETKRRAEAIYATSTATERTQAYNNAKKLLEQEAHPDAGRAVFENVCAKCHLYQGIGKTVGPELSDIRALPVETILKHIVEPNAEVTKGFEAYMVETVDGESYLGVISGESPASITVRQALGIENTIARSDIARIQSSPLSLMPDGLESAMKPQEFRDLIGYLKR